LTPSSDGGPQTEISLGYQRDSGTGNWWLMVDGTWAGYYPSSLFDSEGIAGGSDRIEFGGEIVNDWVVNDWGNGHTTTDMGSGHFPSEGYQHSAYIRLLQYFDANGVLQNATSLTQDTKYQSY